MKYIIQKINLPLELIEIIYSYLDYIKDIKKINRFWYKRLITPDFDYLDHNLQMKKYLFKKEEKMLNILIKNKAFDMINAIHFRNLNIN
tara:strand:- start:5880 stop:6146 length:267 start_codon:yes stop_codon:yes gene_type:complete